MSKLTPVKALSQINKAIIICNKGRRQDALNIFHEVATSMPDDLETLARFAELCVALEDYANAVSVYRGLAERQPDNGAYLGLLGGMYIQTGDAASAIQCLDKSLELMPNRWQTLADLGAIHLLQGDMDKAIGYLEKGIKLKPGDMGINANLASCLIRVQRYEEAIKCVEKAIELDPNNPNGYEIRGTILIELGHMQEAEKSFEKAISMDRLFGAAYYSYSKVRKFSEKDGALIKKMENALRESMPAKQRSHFHFSLGKIYDDCKQWDKAFAHIRQGNLLAKSNFSENPAPKHLFKLLKKVFSREQIEKYAEKLGSDSEIPVFIVGMPRSGTSLVEQIIAGHPNAAGAGELTTLSVIADSICGADKPKEYVQQWQHQLDEKGLQTQIEDYLSVLTQGREGMLRVCDKMPENYLYLGFIAMLFPKAKIVHTIRNPIDTCVSCFFQPFNYVGWSYDLDWIARHYAMYRKVIAYWKSVLPPGMLLDLEYEKLVSESEKYTRLLIDHIGLDWDPACLEYYKGKRTVNTASVWQVRQPIYKSSVKRWQRYTQHITELAKSLADYLDDDDKQALKNAGVKLPMKSWWRRSA